MQINPAKACWLSAFFLTTSIYGQGNQGNGNADTIPPGARGKLQRGVDNGKGPKNTQPKNLIDHGGPVRSASQQYFIWWGTPSDFPADAATQLPALAQGLSNSSYLAIMNQYMRGATATTTFVLSAGDTSAPPSRSPSTATIVDEACKVINANKWTADSNALYTVVTSNFPHNVNFCAWHDHGSCNGVDIQVAYLPNASGVAGCDPGNLFSCNNFTEGTRSLADSYAHEFSEAITDPDLNAWYDAGGSEVADKCSFVYGSCVTLRKTDWQIQEEWSNAVSGCVQQLSSK